MFNIYFYSFVQLKIQSMLLALHERVEKIESCIEEVDTGEELLKKKRKTK